MAEIAVSQSSTQALVAPYSSARNNLGPLKIMLRELANLILEDQDYDAEFIKPTDYSCGKMRELLNSAAHEVSGKFPSGNIYPIGDGGVRCDWEIRDRQVRIVMPKDADGRHYIYIQEGHAFNGDQDINAKKLGSYLNWLKDGNISSSGLQLHNISRA